MEAAQQSPSSPRLSPDTADLELEFREFFTDLLKNALERCANIQDADSTELPASLCEALLRPDPCDHLDCVERLNAAPVCQWDEETIRSCCQGTCSSSGDSAKASLEGVPAYPLYKQLAAIVCDCVLNDFTSRISFPMPELTEDDSQKERIRGWLEQMKQDGTHLLKVFKEVKYRLHVQDEFYIQLRDGLKVVEGRCATGFYTRIQSGDLLLFNNSLLMEVKEVADYKSFQEMLEVEGLSKVLPRIKTVHEGVQVYRRFYSEETEKKGVLAIHVAQPLSVQPFRCLNALLHGLQVEGVMSLLGLRFTKGTIKPALPPPRSALLSSFLAINSDNASGSRLTVGARALAKHVHRSSSGWWGYFNGPEIAKNKVALDVICRLIGRACWMNVHHLPQFPQVFEIRVKDGYGARWSSDGMQFRGFLEPPMKDGHANKWRH